MALNKQIILNKCPSFIELVDALPRDIAVKHQYAIEAIASFICNPQYKIWSKKDELVVNAMPKVRAFLKKLQTGNFQNDVVVVAAEILLKELEVADGS